MKETSVLIDLNLKTKSASYLYRSSVFLKLASLLFNFIGKGFKFEYTGLTDFVWVDSALKPILVIKFVPGTTDFALFLMIEYTH